jgi:putative hemolysin
MLDVEKLFRQSHPQWAQQQPLLARQTASLLRLILREKSLNQLLSDQQNLSAFDFVTKLLERFNFSYRLSSDDRQRIPLKGKVIIIANHPVGSMDGLALLKIIGELRSDVRVLANEILSAVEPLRPMLLSVDNMNGRTSRSSLNIIRQFLDNEGALIVFPAGEVSRFSLSGIRDGVWNSGFLRLAQATRAPILPIHISGHNSIFFYMLSIIAKPLSTLWLVREMFKQAGHTVDIHIGESLNYERYNSIDLPPARKTLLLKQHLYQIGKQVPNIFPPPKALARPEHRRQLRHEIHQGELLKQATDSKQIYLYRHQSDSSIMREVGRLRELSFRAVAEGTGLQRDLDYFDQHYTQLILWDDKELEIIGAYRLGDAIGALAANQLSRLYCSELFEFTANMNPYFAEGLELGRGFIQPKYWRRRNLSYLWQGIGIFINSNPQYRYLFGPVTISESYPLLARLMLVFFYQQHFKTTLTLGRALNPVQIDAQQIAMLIEEFPGLDYKNEFHRLKSALASMSLCVPPMYKQYSELCEPGGTQFVDFNIDPAFSNCIDGLVIIDQTLLKDSRRRRYLGDPTIRTSASVQ